MGHQHHWCDEPPDGRIYFNKTFDERYGDEEDMAHNSYWTSPEELQRLRLLVEKDPGYEASPDWPMLVEWCTSCSITRLARLVLPTVESQVKEEVVEAVPDCNVEEVKASCEATAQDACTQTPRRRRRGGRGSRMRRLLAYQLKLTQKRGLPLSRLLILKESETRYSERKEHRRMQEESASPMLSRKSNKEVEAKGKEVKVDMEEMKKEGEGYFSTGASAGGSTIFTPRSSQSDSAVPTLDSFPLPTTTTFHLSPPSYIWLPVQPFTALYNAPPCGLMPGQQWVICGACNSWGNVVVS